MMPFAGKNRAAKAVLTTVGLLTKRENNRLVTASAARRERARATLLRSDTARAGAGNPIVPAPRYGQRSAEYSLISAMEPNAAPEPEDDHLLEDLAAYTGLLNPERIWQKEERLDDLEEAEERAAAAEAPVAGE